MSLMRQESQIRHLDPGRGVSVATLAWDNPSGHVVAEHSHGSDQLIYAVSGVMEVRSGPAVWLIPPSFALWVPAATPHCIRMPSAVSMRTLYIRPALIRRAGGRCAVLLVSPLLRELVLEAVRIGKLRTRHPEHRALRDLAAFHITRATSIPTETRMPSDPRAFSVASRLLDRLAECPSLKTL